MQRNEPGPDSARLVVVPADRAEGWLERFEQRHGTATCALRPGPAGVDAVVVEAPDGAWAQCEVPFPPMRVLDDEPYLGLLAHVALSRTVGVLLVRRGGYAVGVFEREELLRSKVGSSYVQGRTAAGGWSQQRYARRRDGQARRAFAAAADAATAVLRPEGAQLDAVVLGGSRQALDGVLADPRLTGLRALVSGPVLDVAEPRLRVLQATPAVFRAVRVRIRDPLMGDSTTPD